MRRTGTVVRSELYRMVAEATGYRYIEVKFVIDATFTIIGRLLCQHKPVRIPAFGLFEPFKTSKRHYRGFDDKIYTTDSKYSPKFRAAGRLQEAVEKGDPKSYTLVEEDAPEEDW
jgi:nucleoid DNA-binding protein